MAELQVSDGARQRDSRFRGAKRRLPLRRCPVQFKNSKRQAKECAVIRNPALLLRVELVVRGLDLDELEGLIAINQQIRPAEIMTPVIIHEVTQNPQQDLWRQQFNKSASSTDALLRW